MNSMPAPKPDERVIIVAPTGQDAPAVAELFAGSSVATIVNQIENVRSLLRVEVAEQIL